jgi:hypothetical protein
MQRIYGSEIRKKAKEQENANAPFLRILRLRHLHIHVHHANERKYLLVPTLCVGMHSYAR